ncbi:hypothetical protein B0T10DRAFT_184081 [Thelonectria olida]|uniref:Uncharacterized protein n=1 Tax=Thelonectria olida TaxID=1576542 RepID=A0A9P8WH47_9HYPO|nr:hypothetical protein B0T10DRAFT_184081 [Thelonectria olida]
MDLEPIDEDYAAALAAAAGSAPASASDDDDLAVRMSILSTPDRPKKSVTNYTATTPAPSYFTYSPNYQNDFRDVYHDDNEAAHEPDAQGIRTPSLLSSPSVASSLGFSTGRMSPLRRELSRPSSYHSHSRGPSDPSPIVRRTSRLKRRNRDALARRLSQLAHELTSANDDAVDDEGVDILTAQLEQFEGAVLKNSTTNSSPSTPSPRTTPQRTTSVDLRSPGDSIFSSPASSVFRTRFSDLSASIRRDPEPEPDPDPDPPLKKGMSAAQAKKVIAEAMKLNEELSQLVKNLQARQEESDHIHSLLVERAERAAQRILFLQSRITHLEEELHENDDELQHLRILLKAVEIQMPPHPDKELQRCISSFKQDYQTLKRKRASRSTINTLSSLGSPYPGTPYSGPPSR